MIPSFNGVFCLPDFHHEILAEFPDEQKDSQTALSNWSLHAHNNGIQLPDCEFVDLNTSISNQLDDYIKSSTDSNDILPIELSIVADAEFIDIDILPQRNIPLIKLKEWTNYLNNVCKGLGWWAYSVINTASLRYPTYSLANFPDLGLTVQNFWEPTNDLTVSELNDQNGEDGDESFCRDNYLLFWPSDIAASLDGHGWMVDVKGSLAKPKAVKIHKVLDLIKKTNDAELGMFLTACVDLSNFLDQNSSLGLDSIQTFGKVNSPDYDSNWIIGAACLITWHDPFLHLELVSHYEQMAMECAGNESMRTWRIDHMDSNALDTGLASVKSFIQLHALFGRVLNFYTVEKN